MLLCFKRQAQIISLLIPLFILLIIIRNAINRFVPSSHEILRKEDQESVDFYFEMISPEKKEEVVLTL